jgi:hypothetical protein
MDRGSSLGTTPHPSGQWRNLFVVSNREPYMHMRHGKSVEVMVPPSGVVTALEPMLRACDGTWIAHGSGNADLETVDEHGRLRVPPDDPHYSLRRVWLNQRGRRRLLLRLCQRGNLASLSYRTHPPDFSRGGLAVLSGCQPQVRRCAARRDRDVEKPIVLVQDYHFALLPRLIKESDRMPGWPSSGIFRGRIRKHLAFARGSANWWMVCSAPI